MIVLCSVLQNMLTHVVYAYQSFFDTTPLGRILNRFSQDQVRAARTREIFFAVLTLIVAFLSSRCSLQYLIDESLPDSFSTVFQTFFSVLSTLVVISFVTPLFLVLVVPLVAVYVFTQRYYVSSSRELKRLESVTKSPIYAHFSGVEPSLLYYSTASTVPHPAHTRIHTHVLTHTHTHACMHMQI